MDEQAKLAQEKRLDELALCWKHTPESDTAVKQNLYMQLWEAVYFEKPEAWQNPEGTGNEIKAIIAGFDETKGTFSHYMRASRKNYEKKWNKEVMKRVSHEDSVDDEDNPVAPLRAVVSAPGRAAEVQDTVVEIAAMIQDFGKNPANRSENRESRQWYGLFYTEMITRSMKAAPRLLKRIENAVFKAAELDYLDYYMSRECRTAELVNVTALKSQREVIDSAFTTKKELPDTEVKISSGKGRAPLPAAVPLSFLKRVRGVKSSNPTHSKHFANYEKMIGQYRP